MKPGQGATGKTLYCSDTAATLFPTPDPRPNELRQAPSPTDDAAMGARLPPPMDDPAAGGAPGPAQRSRRASRSDSSRVRTSPSRTGPFTLRMMERLVSSMNSTRTCGGNRVSLAEPGPRHRARPARSPECTAPESRSGPAPW